METGTPLIALLTGRMQWLSARQSVISENVSNADTPNYRARDLKPQNFEKLLNAKSTSGMSITNTRHLSPATSMGAMAPVEIASESTPNGNAVSVEQQMINLSQTQIEYQTAANLYQKAIGMFRTALGGR